MASNPAVRAASFCGSSQQVVGRRSWRDELGECLAFRGVYYGFL